MFISRVYWLSSRNLFSGGGGGAKSIVMQISFVKLIFLLFSDQISGRDKSRGANCLRGAPCPPVEESQCKAHLRPASCYYRPMRNKGRYNDKKGTANKSYFYKLSGLPLILISSLQLITMHCKKPCFKLYIYACYWSQIRNFWTIGCK